MTGYEQLRPASRVQTLESPRQKPTLCLTLTQWEVKANLWLSFRILSDDWQWGFLVGVGAAVVVSVRRPSLLPCVSSTVA